MIATWNLRGMNKDTRQQEISSYLSIFHVPIVALLATRVKKTNANIICKVFGTNWKIIDNYDHHANGRIWILWLELKVELMKTVEQFIHIVIYGLDNSMLYNATVVYTHNQLKRRHILWKEIVALDINSNHPWIVIGDYNNVLNSNNRIGGNNVTELIAFDMAAV
ncbi:unnamed protein product [Vicia faba]|uniref:Uncharacterized protein n=1 Tax=Vicia faba TaxID=3906 RepID=A0AAV1BBE0_VICFA|nr:unnamed protein product [Vicia faba]